MDRTFTIEEVTDAMLFQEELNSRAQVSKKTTIYNSDHNYNGYLSEMMFKQRLGDRKDWESGSTGNVVKADKFDFKVGDKRWDVKAIGTSYSTVIVNKGKWEKAINNKTWLAWYRIINDKGEELGGCHPKEMKPIKIGGKDYYIMDIDSLHNLDTML